MPKISIIILNYKSKGLIKNLINYLLEIPQTIPFEIIVVDNNSHDDIEQLLHKHFQSPITNHQLRFIQSSKNGGYAYGNNLGMRAATGDYYLILNPDIAVFKDGLEKLYQFMENHPQVGMAGPKLINADKSIQESCRRFPDGLLPLARRTAFGKTKWGKKWNNYFLMKDFDHKKSIPVDWLFGATLMVRKKAADEVGLLDELYFMYMEDLDWCRRFWTKGWEVWYVHEAEFIHFHKRQSDDDLGLFGIFKKSGRTHFISWLKYFFKYRSQKLPR